MGSNKHFTMHTSTRDASQKLLPDWGKGARWGVQVNASPASKLRPHHCDPKRCANQLLANFGHNFEHNLSHGMFPWGERRKGESSPQQIELRGDLSKVLNMLNGGPNLVEAVAKQADVMELPDGTKISWINVAAEPARVNGEELGEIMEAFHVFEQASHILTNRNAAIQTELLAGVKVPHNSPLANAYLHPTIDHFSVRRLDLHITETGVFASENDEMPGGLPGAIHIDQSYATNLAQWDRALSWLCDPGLLVFVVSSAWSQCYITETKWLVQELQRRGHQAKIVITEELNRMQITDSGVSCDGKPVATIWRQFPIFETEGKLTELVLAAHSGLVRMVPEFAHYGNKAWFSLFRSHLDEFRQIITTGSYGAYEGDDAPVHQAVEGEKLFNLLLQILPDSHLILDQSSFPLRVSGIEIESYQELYTLSQEARNRLVLKITGANPFSARSYGVFMGHNMPLEAWQKWLSTEREGFPFIVQESLDTKVVQVPVHDIKLGYAKTMSSRILVRPWALGNELVTAQVTAVPSYTRRAHGMVSMSLMPGQLVSKL
jgi:hypothetical protein